jgi:hypothetical protein
MAYLYCYPCSVIHSQDMQVFLFEDVWNIMGFKPFLLLYIDSEPIDIYIFSEFGFIIEFIGCLMFITTNVNSTSTVLDTLHVAIAQSKSSWSAVFSHSHCLVGSLNNRDSFCCFHAGWLLSSLVDDWLPTTNSRPGLVFFCWPSPALSFLVLGPNHIFLLHD